VRDSLQPLVNGKPTKAQDLLERLPQDGSLTLVEFQTIVSQKEEVDDMKRVFSLFDVQQKGYIGLEDLKRIAQDLGESMSDEELQDMMDRADLDHDDRVTVDDFSKIMTKKLFSRE
jgi:Ca2+-binding EF-hand superfamily protein